jgi:hypothetical protein
MIEQSAEIEKLAAALHAAQATVDGVKRTSTNPHFRNRYASLEAVIDTAKPALQANGIAFLQAPGAMVDGSIEITTMLLHTSGQWMRSTLHVPLTKRDAQGAGSAITYGCRYSLMAMLGLPPVDDDGQEASQPAPARQEAPRQQPKLVEADPQDEADRRAYMALATSAIQNAEYADELTQWWQGQAGKRREYGIVKGTREYEELIALVSDTRDRLPANVMAAG